MPRPANWKSDGPTRMERIRHLSWAHYRDMTACKRCGAPLPDQSRSRGRKRTYCSAACQGGRVTPAEGITGVSVYQRHNEIAKRAADIQRDPELRAQMDRLRRGQVLRVPMAWRFDQMKRARMREEQRGMR